MEDLCSHVKAAGEREYAHYREGTFEEEQGTSALDYKLAPDSAARQAG